MVDYANVHFALETLRNEAKQQGRDSPRVLIVGPDDAGKTSLAKILTGYAVRIGRQPMIVNLDTNEGMLSVPGTMTAAVFKTMIDVEEGWGTSPMSGPSAIPVKLPLTYYYGLPDPDEKDGQVYRYILSRLALAVSGRLASDPETRESGIIIDTPGSISQSKTSSTSIPYATISHIISEFSISAILVLGSERLYSDLQKRFDNKAVSLSSSSSSTSTTAHLHPTTISVIKLAKSGGAVSREESYRRTLLASQIRSYFFGNPALTNGINLSPHQQTIDPSTLSIYRLQSTSTSSSGLPADLFAPGADDSDSNSDNAYDPSSSSLTTIPALSRTSKPSKSSSSSSSLYTALVAPTAAMTNSILTILNHAPLSLPLGSTAVPGDDAASLRDASVLGFLYVAEVDEGKRRITVLSPVAGRVPDRAIVWGAWPEEVVGMV